MILQILIPQYKEKEEDIRKLLDSIKIQRNINFDDIGVIIVNDGSDVHLSRYFLESYPFEIKYILNEHKGVSATRNKALKEATADYIMFCDADDMFYHVLALQLIIKTINQQKPKCIYSTFLEELENNNGLNYLALQQSFVFVHGKIYERQFLIDNDIYWDEELYLHEDGYFNGLALGQIDRKDIAYCDEPFYIWCHNPNSVSRKETTFVLDTYDQNLKAQDKLIMKLINKNPIEAINLVAIQLFQTYFLLTGKFKDFSETKEVDFKKRKTIKNTLKYIEKLYVEFYDKFKDCYKHVSNEERERLFLSSQAGSTFFRSEKPTSIKKFNKFLSKIKLKYNIEFDDTFTFDKE